MEETMAEDRKIDVFLERRDGLQIVGSVPRFDAAEHRDGKAVAFRFDPSGRITGIKVAALDDARHLLGFKKAP
jgi:hypothetical protein